MIPNLQLLVYLLIPSLMSADSGDYALPRNNNQEDFIIKNIDLDGYVLDLAHHYVPGAEIILYTEVNSDQQHFTIENIDYSEYFHIIHPSSGLYCQTLPGSELLHAGSKNIGWRSHWKIIEQGENVYVIQNRYTEQILGCFTDFLPVVLGDGETAGAIHLQDWVPDQRCQKWSLLLTD